GGRPPEPAWLEPGRVRDRDDDRGGTDLAPKHHRDLGHRHGRVLAETIDEVLDPISASERAALTEVLSRVMP
ncbi:MAG: hypothetical protein AAFX59_10020, partial [Pseudomonadota bacterium]